MAEWSESTVWADTLDFDEKPLQANRKSGKVQPYRHALMDAEPLHKCPVHGPQPLFTLGASGYATLACGADGDLTVGLGFGHYV